MSIKDFEVGINRITQHVVKERTDKSILMALSFIQHEMDDAPDRDTLDYLLSNAYSICGYFYAILEIETI